MYKQHELKQTQRSCKTPKLIVKRYKSHKETRNNEKLRKKKKKNIKRKKKNLKENNKLQQKGKVTQREARQNTKGDNYTVVCF